MLRFRSATRLVATGHGHSCATTATRELLCYGQNDQGQTDEPMRARYGVVAIATLYKHTCVIVHCGKIYCWGSNLQGQSDVPGVLLLKNKKGNKVEMNAVTTGYDHTCALVLNGQMKCWGDNEYGQNAVPVKYELNTSIISAGYGHTCALDQKGSLGCWGFNNCGQCNVPNEFKESVYFVTAGYGNSCAITLNAFVFCWGTNYYNQSQIPYGVSNTLTIAIVTGNYFSCVQSINFSVYCWGLNDHGETDVPKELRYNSENMLGEDQIIDIEYYKTNSVDYNSNLIVDNFKSDSSDSTTTDTNIYQNNSANNDIIMHVYSQIGDKALLDNYNDNLHYIDQSYTFGYIYDTIKHTLPYSNDYENTEIIPLEDFDMHIKEDDADTEYYYSKN